MTTYVLHGGVTSKADPRNDDFFAQFTSLVDKDTVKILICYWAREEDRWIEKFEGDSKKVLEQTEKDVELSIVKDPKDLLERIGDYDVLYVAGGDAEPIERHLPELKGLGENLDGKIYLGSSMGAFIVANEYVLSYDSQDSSSVHNGLGLVPMSMLCHWDVEGRKAEKIALLKESNPNNPILLLDECESVTFVL